MIGFGKVHIIKSIETFIIKYKCLLVWIKISLVKKRK